ncbi:hypothetical protein E2493_12845 [Sphingomonas parva]|uniref:Uncharacterized protein n=1 Tax=Sphingomonas parva TaxID=2555898 RepID=A0A4Y8ZPC6_9SPHN|nr:hypothetical protein [Sphingomonas parva]TFI57871.1 hypothetical protein E2493_12845 [Sphingomonas parva]
MFKCKAAVAALLPLAIVGCSSDGQLTATGITVTRSACPAVGIPASTGDITLFNPENSRDASAIDVVAHITNVRSTCDESGENIVSTVNFEIRGQRRDASGAREVVLPYFAVVVQGGTNVVSKSVSRVGLRFEDGQLRATATGTATGSVLRSAATLPEDIRRQVTRERKPGDPDAAVDPLADPTVREAVRRASFEVLVGFQLTEAQLAYNATR